MSKPKREVSSDYVEEFIGAIKNGNPVTLVQVKNLLAVDHPSLGTMVLQLKDKVVFKKDKKKTDGSEETK